MPAPITRSTLLFAVVLVAGITWGVPVARAQDEGLPVYLRDRGTGMPTSMFGSYIKRNEFIVYPFFEYYLDNDLEYKPSELGYGLDRDFRGKFRASEGILFLGYGVTDWLALEFEAAYISASLKTAPNDPSLAPNEIKEKGTGDVEGQVRARLVRETQSRPEFFSYFEAVSPQQKDKVLIGTPDWELKFGLGMIKGLSWGTVTVRGAGEYTVENSSFDTGEYALEYLKRISPGWRVYAGFEGAQDQLSLITEIQRHFSDRVILKVNNGIGITSKATDWAPEIGLMFVFSQGE